MEESAGVGYRKGFPNSQLFLSKVLIRLMSSLVDAFIFDLIWTNELLVILCLACWLAKKFPSFSVQAADQMGFILAFMHEMHSWFYSKCNFLIMIVIFFQVRNLWGIIVSFPFFSRIIQTGGCVLCFITLHMSIAYEIHSSLMSPLSYQPMALTFGFA